MISISKLHTVTDLVMAKQIVRRISEPSKSQKSVNEERLQDFAERRLHLITSASENRANKEKLYPHLGEVQKHVWYSIKLIDKILKKICDIIGNLQKNKRG
jgi:phosphatidylinositol kinase/protein kinase (PI-3  family)